VNAGRRTRALLKAGRLFKELGGGGDKLGVGADLHLEITPLSLGPETCLLFFGDVSGGHGHARRQPAQARRAEERPSSAAEPPVRSAMTSPREPSAVWRDPPSTHPVLVFQWRPSPG
jgi:hypothetical protein